MPMYVKPATMARPGSTVMCVTSPDCSCTSKPMTLNSSTNTTMANSRFTVMPASKMTVRFQNGRLRYCCRYSLSNSACASSTGRAWPSS